MRFSLRPSIWSTRQGRYGQIFLNWTWLCDSKSSIPILESPTDLRMLNQDRSICTVLTKAQEVRSILFFSQLHIIRYFSDFKAERLPRPRGPLWRSRKGLSREVQQVVRDLRRYQDDANHITELLKTKVSRLLKVDLLAVLTELQREKMARIALLIFGMVRRETWYKPDVFLYKDMLRTLATAKLLKEMEDMFACLKEEGVEPELNIYTELLRGYLHCNKIMRAVEVVEEMREAGCPPDFPCMSMFCKHLEKSEEVELATKYTKELNKIVADEREAGKFPKKAKKSFKCATGV